MSDARLPAALEASAIRRLVESEGGHAIVARRGDPDRGVLLLEIRERGRFHAFLERSPGADGAQCWVPTGHSVDSNPAEMADFLKRRARFDPDMWLIELDVPDAQRFIAETGTIG